VLETINLALNPFDEHYIDRDLSRTGLCMTVVTPGTGHFSVDKNLLRLTTERMADHGISLDLVCLTKMPLHSVPLFSYLSKRPKVGNGLESEKQPTSTPDLLYFDAHLSAAVDPELTTCYCAWSSESSSR
jgi:DEP domain-containing protein 5